MRLSDGSVLHPAADDLQEVHPQPVAERIRQDPRHHDFHVLSWEPIEVREFADWAMGCFHVEDCAEHDARRLHSAMAEFLEDPTASFREAVGFFRLFLRFDRERLT